MSNVAYDSLMGASHAPIFIIISLFINIQNNFTKSTEDKKESLCHKKNRYDMVYMTFNLFTYASCRGEGLK